jgi:thiol-disulfide isomerase/thioredoxin
VVGEKSFGRCLLIWVAILCLGILCVGAGADPFSKIDIKSIKDKKTVPNITLMDLKGGNVELKNVIKGKVVFLNFWATWCGPCKEEMPSMEALYKEYKEKNFIFLTISVDYEGLPPVKAFIERTRYTFPVLLDPKNDTLDLFAVSRIPTTFIIDKEGRMIGRALGPRNWKSPEVEAILKQLIGK